MIENLIAELERCIANADAAGEMLAAVHISAAIESLKSSLRDGPSTRHHMAPFSDLENTPAAFRFN